jgi:hypothetical protein
LNIFNWRNETLHGQETAQFVGGILLNLCVLILIWSNRGNLEEQKSAIIENLDQERQRGSTPWSYYRPIKEPHAERVVPGLAGYTYPVAIEAHVLLNREAHFGIDGPSPHRIAAIVAQEASAVGSQRTLITTRDDWWYVCADFDWLKALNISGFDRESIFHKGRGLAERGEIQYRPEALVTAFSDNAVSVSDGSVYRIKGDAPDHQTVINRVAALGEWNRVIGFHFSGGPSTRYLDFSRRGRYGKLENDS